MVFLDVPFANTDDRNNPHKTLVRVLNKTNIWEAAECIQMWLENTDFQPILDKINIFWKVLSDDKYPCIVKG